MFPLKKNHFEEIVVLMISKMNIAILMKELAIYMIKNFKIKKNKLHQNEWMNL